MKNLKKYLGKKVEIIDSNDKKWVGVVEEYDSDDDFCDYRGESIDVTVDDPLKNVVFGTVDIKSIREIA